MNHSHLHFASLFNQQNLIPFMQDRFMSTCNMQVYDFYVSIILLQVVKNKSHVNIIMLHIHKDVSHRVIEILRL